VKYTQKYFPWVDVLEAGANLGFAKGNNRAIEYAKSKYDDIDYFVLLNTDARIREDWLKVLLDFAAQKPLGALFQSTTLDYYDHSIVDSTHIYISRNGSGTQAGWRSPYRGDTGPKKVFGVNAAAAMISNDFIKAQPFKNLFDETMFMYLEDVDLSARATVMGWDNYLVPNTFAYHMGSASSGKNPGFSLYMTYRNNIAMLAKNIPLSMLFKMTYSMFTADRHTIKHLRRVGQKDSVKKLIKGRIAGAIRLPLYISAIYKMHRYRKSTSKEYLWRLMKKGN
jgi:GT2 family glycosyltransferase